MKKIILMVLMVLFVCGYVFAGENTDFTKIYEGKGVVTFNHNIHSDVTDCNKCHDKLKNGMTKTFGHKTCKNCHKKEKTGPVKCTECHKK